MVNSKISQMSSPVWKKIQETYILWHTHLETHTRQPGVTYQLGDDEGVAHEIQQGRLCVDVVEGVGGFEALVSRVVHDCGGECVEAQEVS